MNDASTRLCLAVTSWFHKLCRQLVTYFCWFSHTLKKHKCSTFVFTLIFCVLKEMLNSFFNQTKTQLRLWAHVLSEHLSFAKIIHAVLPHIRFVLFYFKSELLIISDQSCFCFQKSTGLAVAPVKLLASVTSYAGDVAFQPKAWKMKIHHLLLRGIKPSNRGADSLLSMMSCKTLQRHFEIRHEWPDHPGWDTSVAICFFEPPPWLGWIRHAKTEQTKE